MHNMPVRLPDYQQAPGHCTTIIIILHSNMGWALGTQENTRLTGYGPCTGQDIYQWRFCNPVAAANELHYIHLYQIHVPL